MTLVSGYLVLTHMHGNDRDDDDDVTQHGSHTPADRTWQAIPLDIFTMRNFNKLGLHVTAQKLRYKICITNVTESIHQG